MGLVGLRYVKGNQMHSIGDRACSSMVVQASQTLPTRVQILVLGSFSGFISGFFGVMR
jgi:hypothetical protein